MLGGIPQKVLTGFDGPVTFSPDGKRLAFRRYYPQQGETALIVANAEDGSGEQILAGASCTSFFQPAGRHGRRTER